MPMSPKQAEVIRVRRGLDRGTRLRILRVEKGISRSDLAKRSGVPLKTIEHFEQNENQINGTKLDTLYRLCSVLECKIPEILDSDELIKKFNEVK